MGNHFVRALCAFLCLGCLPLTASTLFTTGTPDLSDGREVTEFVQGSSFALGFGASLNGVEFWAAHPDDLCADLPSCVLLVTILNTAPGGGVGAEVASLSLTPSLREVTMDTLAGYFVHRYRIDIPVLALGAGSYWISLHNGPLTNTVPAEFFWLTAAPIAGLKTAEGTISGGPPVVAFAEAADGNFAFTLFGPDGAPVPEPSTAVLTISVGLLGLLFKRCRAHVLAVGLVAACGAAHAQTSIAPGTPELDPPTYTSLGLRLPIAGDTDYDASIAVRYRVVGTTPWQTGLPLFRVRPETVFSLVLAQQFGGTIFDLRPATSYEIELIVSDPDGGGLTRALTAQTLGLPQGPVAPRVVNVSTSVGLQTALDNALPGDVITLADGVYSGTRGGFPELWLTNSGTAANPIVIRGLNADKAILDGQGCAGCIALIIQSAGYVHVENLTIRNVVRGIRFIGVGSSNFLVRRIRTVNIESPVFSTSTAGNVAVVDNVFHGQLVWPQIFPNNPELFGIREGVSLAGSGNIVAHNRLSGFADSINFRTHGHRGQDIYGNDIYDAYDNAVELDGGASNLRAYRNRITNAYMPLSVQPVLGGPAYFLRNEMYNVVFEPFKFHAVFDSPTSVYSQTSGVLVYHNTSINSEYAALGIETPETTHNFEIKNNVLFAPPGRPALTWGTPVNFGLFDYNAYYPDGYFWWKEKTGFDHFYPNFAAMRASNDIMEIHGRLVTPAATFGGGFASLLAHETRRSPQRLALAAGSPALDVAQPLAGINSSFAGGGPDLGALERGCASPWYGPRPPGMDESNQRRGCETPLAAVASASFVRTDAATKGTWVGKYGALGYSIADVATLAPGIAVSTNGNLEVWQSPSSSLKALRRPAPATGRVAAGWSNFQDLYVTVDAGASARQVALYLLDWGTAPTRRIFVELIDANGNLLDTRPVDDFSGGVYLVWNVTGQVRFRVVQHLGAASAVVSGVFIDPAQ